jgi:hypothetical protein
MVRPIKRRHFGVFAVLAAMALMLTLPSLASAAPANDNFANAQTISGQSVSVNGTTAGATREVGEPDHYTSNPADAASWLGDHSVWYRWTAPETKRVTIDTCTANIDSILAVYTGSSLENLSRVADNNNDYCGPGWGSKVTFQAAAGTTYQIAVSDAGGATQNTFALNVQPFVPLANDNFADAQTISGAFASVEGTNIGATTETGETGSSFVGSGSVWYRWTAPETGHWRVDTCASGTADFDSVLSVHTGSVVDSLTDVASNDNGCSGASSNVYGSKLNFNGTAGTTYYIRVASDPTGLAPRQGNFTLNLESFVPVANDDFAKAEAISGALASVEGTNIDATTETGEPAPFYSSSSVWYSWTAPATGGVKLDTCASDFDTVLSVHTGSTLGSLTRVTENDDGCWDVGPNGYGSKLSFNGTAGTTYYIRVAGYFGSEGTFTLDLVLSDGVPPDTSITDGPTGLTADDTPTFTFGGSDNKTASANLLYSYRVDNGGWSAYSNQSSATLPSLSDGDHTFYVKAKDEAGNEDADPATRSFTVETRSPKVERWSPTGTKASRLGNITATFSEPMKLTTITTSNIKVAAGTKTVPVAVTLSADAKTATIDPSQALLANKKCTVTITTAVQDLHGKALDQDSSRAGNQSMVWSFNTGSS